METDGGWGMAEIKKERVGYHEASSSHDPPTHQGHTQPASSPPDTTSSGGGG